MLSSPTGPGGVWLRRSVARDLDAPAGRRSRVVAHDVAGAGD
jgi:hypothetical protein